MNDAKIYVRDSPNAQWQTVAFDDAKKIATSLYVYARGCTALTSLDAKAAKTVDARGCTALTSLDAKAAELSRLSLGENNHDLIIDLLPWKEERSVAIAIFEAANPQVGDWCEWIHHEIRFERLSEPWRNRFTCFDRDKPEEERAWRYRLMRPSSVEAVQHALTHHF